MQCKFGREILKQSQAVVSPNRSLTTHLLVVPNLRYPSYQDFHRPPLRHTVRATLLMSLAIVKSLLLLRRTMKNIRQFKFVLSFHLALCIINKANAMSSGTSSRVAFVLQFRSSNESTKQNTELQSALAYAIYIWLTINKKTS